MNRGVLTILAVVLATACPAKREPSSADGPARARPAAARPDGPAPDLSAGRPGRLGRLDGFELRTLRAAAFSRLSPRSKRLAYHLIQACEAGSRVLYAQHHPHNLEIKDLLENLVLDPGLSGDLRPKLERYLGRFWLHRGHHDLRGGRKFVPSFTEQELRQATSAAHGRGINLGLHTPRDVDLLLRRLKPALFDPGVGAWLVAPSGGGHDRLAAGAMNLYRGVTEAEARAFKHRFPRNSRLVKHRGAFTEEVWRAGTEGVSEGRYANELHHVVKHLNRALPLARGDQALALGHLVKHLLTGEPRSFRRFVERWERSEAEVEFALGFISTHRDPLGLKGTYQAVVATGCQKAQKPRVGGEARVRRCELIYACGDPGPKGRWELRLGKKKLVWTNLGRPEPWAASLVPAAYVAVGSRASTGAVVDVRAHLPASWTGYNLARSRAWRLQSAWQLRRPPPGPHGRLLNPLHPPLEAIRRRKGP